MRQQLVSGFVIGACFMAAGACGSDGTADGNQISGNSSGSSGSNGSDGGGSPNGDDNGNGNGIFGNNGLGNGNASGAEDAGDAGCGESPFEASRKPVNVLIVLDKSGSMDDPLGGASGDKWTAVQTALDTALNESKEDVAFGLDLYPVGSESCGLPSDAAPTVAVGDGTTSVPMILSALGATSPSGGTPTADALDRALQYFTTGDGASREGDMFVLLATDGGPNCNADIDPICGPNACTTNLDGDCPDVVGNCCDPPAGDPIPGSCLDTDRTVQRIEDLSAAGAGTFVVGIPGSEAYSDQLDAMAEAGGHAQSGDTKYFEVSAMGGVAGLTQVFQDITTELVRTCELQLESEPPDDGKLNIDVDGTRLARGEEDGDGSDWWLNESTNPATVVIQGEACNDIKEQGAERINVVFGCPSVPFRPPE